MLATKRRLAIAENGIFFLKMTIEKSYIRIKNMKNTKAQK